MATARNGDIELHYDSFGSADDPTLLLVMGFTAQMISWREAFCGLLAESGFHVVRFDNRDCGLSTKTAGDPPNTDAITAARLQGDPMPELPYMLSDMGADAFAVMDAVGAERAHIVGASMGGMIVQQMTIDQPDRVASMCSIMSTTGDPSVGAATPEALEALLVPPPEGREATIEQNVVSGRVLAGPLFDADVHREFMTMAYDRAHHPAGAPFQLGAILASPDRTEALTKVAAPTLVVHGLADELITPSGGEATAAAVPGATLLTFEQMGHDLPPALWPEIVDAIVSNAHRAS